MQPIFPELRLLFVMKRAVLFYMIVLFSFAAQAQEYDSWQIYHNRKEVSKFNDKKETTDERRLVLLNRIMEGPGFFIIEFTPAKEQEEWIRTIAFYDSTDNLIREFKNTLFLRIHNSDIAAIMEGRQKVKVFSWAIPNDPAIAATVRVRRQLLCTLYTR